MELLADAAKFMLAAIVVGLSIMLTIYLETRYCRKDGNKLP